MWTAHISSMRSQLDAEFLWYIVEGDTKNGANVLLKPVFSKLVSKSHYSRLVLNLTLERSVSRLHLSCEFDAVRVSSMNEVSATAYQ